MYVFISLTLFFVSRKPPRSRCGVVDPDIHAGYYPAFYFHVVLTTTLYPVPLGGCERVDVGGASLHLVCASADGCGMVGIDVLARARSRTHTHAFVRRS
jgi:hypothetical protein